MALSCTYYYDVHKYRSTSLCDQNCGVQPADRQTESQTDKSLKTEGPKFLSNDIFYFRTGDHWRSKKGKICGEKTIKNKIKKRF